MIKTVWIENSPNRGSILRLKDNRLELQIWSPPFRWKINEPWISPPNIRSIGSQAKQDRPLMKFEQWRKTEFFSLTSKMVVLPFSLFSPSTLFFFYLWWLQKIGRRIRIGILLLTLLYKGLRGLKFWALNLGLSHEKKPNRK